MMIQLNMEYSNLNNLERVFAVNSDYHGFPLNKKKIINNNLMNLCKSI